MSKRFELLQNDGTQIFLKRWLRLYEGETLVRHRKAVPICDDDGRVVAFELLWPGVGATPPDQIRAALGLRKRRDFAEGFAGASCAVLSKAEVEAAVGLRGASRTAGEVESVRQAFGGVDFVERSREKLRCFRPGSLQTVS